MFIVMFNKRHCYCYCGGGHSATQCENIFSFSFRQRCASIMKNVGGMRAYKVKWKCPISWLYPAELSYICLPLPSTRKYSIQIYDHYQLSSESAPSPTSETMASSPEVPSHWSQQTATQSVHLVRLQGENLRTSQKLNGFRILLCTKLIWSKRNRWKEQKMNGNCSTEPERSALFPSTRITSTDVFLEYTVRLLNCGISNHNKKRQDYNKIISLS